MATGKCVNIGKPCSKALKRYVIEADKTNFVCPECGGKLVPCDGPVTDPDSLKKGGASISAEPTIPPKNKKLVPIIGGVIALAAIGGGTAYYLTSSGEESVQPITHLEIADYDPALWVGTTDTLTVKPTPVDAKATYIWSSSNESVVTVMNGILKVVGEGETTITVKVEGNEEISASATFYAENYAETPVDEPNEGGKEKKPESTPPLVSNKIDLGFAIYQGDIKNGKPEGNGVMTFKSRQVIPGSKGDIVAEPGEYAEGTWRNGEVNLVTLHQKNGNKPIITHK